MLSPFYPRHFIYAEFVPVMTTILFLRNVFHINSVFLSGVAGLSILFTETKQVTACRCDHLPLQAMLIRSRRRRPRAHPR